ncbi:chemotaxis response regulator protein-glutamate methylesterase [Psychromonas sp. psych-6C06]|uniref:protein-glutamate methylesterase/protein-glutamine glutaminase n=1 Tax=Psychromonas sp. psych-6C06 TaxID=2058089 RepID=UPI000C3454FA|nr:chemotaxis response regulator protein-glutamate methylesterase [Psychromonas sp. psych-6C06]PKF62926.1 chemotaxis response regulator protein-glutamate methylesterase [Psychromonas sp. psych-6C06]
MAIKVLVVDDSSFFRRRVSEIINKSPALEVIATANNGQEAIDMVAKYKPDVVTMDIEMPVMDGITAVKKIMAINPLPILMFSSLTHQGASATLDALEAGASDFLPKKFEDIARDKEEAIKLLQQRIQAIASRRVSRVTSKSSPTSTANSTPKPALSALKKLNERNHAPKVQTTAQLRQTQPLKAATKVVDSVPANKFFKASGKSYEVLAIGTSTGGPVALQTVLTALPRNFKLPILLIQHMPGTFTKAFAERLNGLCQISVKEASDGDVLQPGCAYLAPGGKQMLLDGRSGSAKIRIHDGSEKLNYKPSVDITFASLSKFYGKKVLAVVLTGMGADGRDGARMLKEQGAEIWAQDEASCVVYGMPQAVTKAGIATESLPLDQVSRRILVELKYE